MNLYRAHHSSKLETQHGIPYRIQVFNPKFEKIQNKNDLDAHRQADVLSNVSNPFFLQFAEFNVKAPPYSKTLQYSKILISRAAPPFRSIFNQNHGNSSRGNEALKKYKFFYFYIIFFYYWGRYY